MRNVFLSLLVITNIGLILLLVGEEKSTLSSKIMPNTILENPCYSSFTEEEFIPKLDNGTMDGTEILIFTNPEENVEI
jgi:hypothetical protein